MSSTPPEIERRLLNDLVRRHPHGDARLEHALRDAIRTTWATALNEGLYDDTSR